MEGDVRSNCRKKPPIQGRLGRLKRSVSRSEKELSEGEEEGEYFSSNPELTRTNIEVIVRIRPETLKELQLGENGSHRVIVKALDETTVVFDPKVAEKDFYYQGIRQKLRVDFNKRPNKDKQFAFDRVYGPEKTNRDIFEGTMKKVVHHIIKGFNCSVFAYGATGAGKTWTMLGTLEQPGLCFFMAMELYNKINSLANKYLSEICVSYLEVYNETIRDLLHPSGILAIQEDAITGVNIPNLTLHKPKDAVELLSMLAYGNSLRSQHPTDQNEESSRSHAIFQISVSLRRRYSHSSKSMLKYKTTKAKIQMVDLAGSEKGSSGLPDGLRLREGSNINKSLLALGNCINSLADGKKHIPYRDSKLTRILKDSLGGHCKTIMIANLSPSSLNYDDTYNTLKYADRAKEIKVQLKKSFGSNEDGSEPYCKIIEDLKLEIEFLKDQLKKKDEIKNYSDQLSVLYEQSKRKVDHNENNNSKKDEERLMLKKNLYPNNNSNNDNNHDGKLELRVKEEKSNKMVNLAALTKIRSKMATRTLSKTKILGKTSKELLICYGLKTRISSESIKSVKINKAWKKSKNERISDEKRIKEGNAVGDGNGKERQKGKQRELNTEFEKRKKKKKGGREFSERKNVIKKRNLRREKRRKKSSSSSSDSHSNSTSTHNKKSGGSTSSKASGITNPFSISISEASIASNSNQSHSLPPVGFGIGIGTEKDFRGAANKIKTRIDYNNNSVSEIPSISSFSQHSTLINRPKTITLTKMNKTPFFSDEDGEHDDEDEESSGKEKCIPLKACKALTDFHKGVYAERRTKTARILGRRGNYTSQSESTTSESLNESCK